MNGAVKFEGNTLDAKTSADAVGRILSGQMDIHWCRTNNQMSVRGIWNRETDVLIKSPVSLWKKMCSGYHPREGRDYEFVACGTLTNAEVGCFGREDTESAADGALTYDDDANGFHAYVSGDAEGDDWVSEYLELYEYNATHFNDEKPDAEAVSVPAGDDTDSAAMSWRAEVIESALDEDAESQMMEIVHDAYAAMPESALETAYRRALAKERRHWAILMGFKPYVPAYDLALNVATFEGEVYRVIDPVTRDDIPF